MINANARGGADASTHAVAAFEARGHTVVEERPGSSADITAAIARHRGAIDVVAVGGGDGTLISAIDGIRQIGLPMLILPLGTINELARTLGLPFDIPAACALIDEGRTRPIDAGRANGVWFFNEASIGFSNHVVQQQTSELKRRAGMLAIPIGALRALRRMRPYHLTASWAGGEQTFRTVQLTVANSHRFGGVVEVVDAAIDDGMLDLYSIDIRGAWDAVGVVSAVARKQFSQARNVSRVRAAAFRITSRHSHHVFADGEAAGKTPVDITVVPHAIDVLVPQ